MKVVLLTPEQKESIAGKEYAPDAFYYPIQDNSGNWVISLQEVEQSSEEWVKKLPLIDFEPIQTEIKL